MKIAIIDEGILPIFKDQLNIVEDLMVNDDNLVVNRRDDVQIISDHGFNVCKIINTYAPNAEIVSIRIFNSSDVKANIQALITAFQYCLDKNIPIIHLSGGTVNLADDYLLRDVIKKIINNNQIIIAAHSNKKGLSFPAIYPGVFSVRADELFNSYDGFQNRWGYSFTMPSQHKININENTNYITQISNSYAAPALTANIYNIAKSSNNIEVEAILRELGVVNNILLCDLAIFLDDVIIINLDSKLIVEELLQFKVRNIYHDIRFEIDGQDYIFIPHKNKEINIIKFKEFLDILAKGKDRIRIFYLGKADKIIESIMATYPFEFWLNPNNDIYPIGISYKELNECGRIYFRGNNEDVYYIMTGLRDAFLEDGYNCFPISDYIEASLYGIYYFEDLVNSIRRQQLEYVFQPDVELVYSKVGDYRERENSMLIEVLNEGDKIKLLISEKGRREEIDIKDKEDIKKLFKGIVNDL